MAVTNLEIIQDCKIYSDATNSYCDLVAGRSPVPILIKATHDGDAPDELYATAFKGVYDAALTFDGVDDYVSLPFSRTDLQSSFPDVPPNAFTIASWMTPIGTLVTSPIVSNLGTNSGCEMGLTYDLIARFSFWDSGTSSFNELRSPTRLRPGRWYHIAVTFDGVSVYKIYLNGVLGETVTSSTEVQSTTNFTIGCRPALNTYSPMILGSVSFHRFEYTQEMILRHMKREPDGYEYIPFAVYNFNQMTIGEYNLSSVLKDMADQESSDRDGTLHAFGKVVRGHVFATQDKIVQGCIPIGDDTDVTRVFMFDAQMMKHYLSDFEDFDQDAGTLAFMEGYLETFTFFFHEPTDDFINGPRLTLRLMNASRNIGYEPNLLSLWNFNNIESDTYDAIAGQPRDYYFVASPRYVTTSNLFLGAGEVSGDDRIRYDSSYTDSYDEILCPVYGLYRFRTQVYDPDCVNQEVVVAAGILGSKTSFMHTRYSVCANARIVKFLDMDGCYKNFPFSENYSETTKKVSIGSVEKIITNLATSRSSSLSTGYKGRSIVTLKTYADTEDLEYLKDLWYSPRVYLLLDTGNWVLTNLKTDGDIKRLSNIGGVLTIQLELPENHSQKLL